MFFVALFFSSILGFCAEDFSGKDSMNDIAFSEYKDFPEKWGLVTIRFRKDTGELRFTYANELAMKTLASGAINYPDGAVFAKTGVHTSPDPDFVSSIVPKGIRRYQIMVKNKAKYSTTGGWGYGLYDANGKTFPEDPKITQDACYAYHTIVESKGDVFSELFSFTKNTKFPLPGKAKNTKAITYAWRNVKDLPATISKFIPKTVPKIHMITNSFLRDNIFQGTLDEVKPILEDQAKKIKGPTLFASKDFKKFVVVIPTKNAECNDFGSFDVVSTDINLNAVVDKYCVHD